MSRDLGQDFLHDKDQKLGTALTILWLLARNLYGHPLAGPIWQRKFEEVPFKVGWVKVPLVGLRGRHEKGSGKVKTSTPMANQVCL